MVIIRVERPDNLRHPPTFPFVIESSLHDGLDPAVLSKWTRQPWRDDVRFMVFPTRSRGRAIAREVVYRLRRNLKMMLKVCVVRNDLPQQEGECLLCDAIFPGPGLRYRLWNHILFYHNIGLR